MTIDWRAFELHPGIPREGMKVPWPPERMAAARANFERLAREAGLETGERTHWYASTLAHEACEWVREQGSPEREDNFRRGVFRAYFVHDRNIASADVLAEVAAASSYAPDQVADLRVALAERRCGEVVAKQYEEARALGVTGVPTFVCDGYALVGAQPYEQFQRLMAVVGAAPRAQLPD